MEIIEERRKLRERCILEAKEWASRIQFKVTAILIGSYARGDFNIWSDIDVLIISEELTENPLKRLKDLDIPPGYQVIALTLKEFEKLLEKGEPMITEAIKYRIVLRDDLNIFSIMNGDK
ncbi:MAG: nucleotidyltransferase domain-containing protein [Candidatus Methanomethyliaceae archaeon]|nr:nucleotidyltransferase domain-containing protein [Candidatus Methanomethyliaceae archaeon]MDW7970985.1 nucleotidyltransferase domain-containing protein [Nitrososphaerota archaeon]